MSLLAGCDDARQTFGDTGAKARHLVQTQFHLTHVRFDHESRGYSPDVACGLVTAESPQGRIDKVEFVANGDADSAVINNQALSLGAKRPVVPNQRQAIDDDVADCVFPQIWKAMCRQPLSAHLLEQQKRCPP